MTYKMTLFLQIMIHPNKKYRDTPRSLFQNLFPIERVGYVFRNRSENCHFWPFPQKVGFWPFWAFWGYTLILVIFGDPYKNPIFQDFPILAIFGVYPILGNFGYLGKSGILAKMIKIVKKVIFGKSVEIGYTVKMVKMTDLGKNVKNRYSLTGSILTFFKDVERSPSGVNTDILSYTV